MKQLITISPVGHIETLQRKRGKGLDIRTLVKRKKIKRISLVEWDEDEQKWFITLQLGELAGQRITHDLVRKITGAEMARRWRGDGESENGALLWCDYDDAVLCEISVIDAARKLGHCLLVGTADEQPNFV